MATSTNTRPVLIMLLIACMLVFGCIKEGKKPGAQTTVHGVVKDFRTGEVFANVKVGITKQYQLLADGPSFSDYDFVYSNADGSYTLTFIPKGSGNFTIRIRDAVITYNFAGGGSYDVILGKDNQVDFPVYRTLNLTVRLTNLSTQNRKLFDFNIDSCCTNSAFNLFALYGQRDIYRVKTDTTLLFKVPQLAHIQTTSRYYNGYGNSGLLDTLTFKKTFQLHKADTVINITNP